jgi:hypothetical protein
MTIDRISYQKTFNLGNYSSERIGVDMVLNEGEDAKFALSECKKLVEEYHRESEAEYPHQCIEERIIPVNKSTAEHLADEINSCKEVKVLESYKLIVKNDSGLQLLYDSKHKSLTK